MPQRRHLRRLDRIFERYEPPLFFVTCCVRERAPLLATEAVARVLEDGWRDAESVHGWLVGRFVIMPEHVHFFCAPVRDCPTDLSQFIGQWKRWTGGRIRQLGLRGFKWQPEFFDHLIREGESYQAKWHYVRENPVRAGLVAYADEWAYQGEVNRLEW